MNSYKGHYKQWWHFAYKCVLEGEVKRKKKNWDWTHMLAHRKMGKEYADLYRKELRKSVSTIIIAVKCRLIYSILIRAKGVHGSDNL